MVPLSSTPVPSARVVVSRQRWTPDELALLDGPASDVEVAELVGRSVHAVMMKRWRRRNPAAVARDRVYAEEFSFQALPTLRRTTSRCSTARASSSAGYPFEVFT